MKIHNLFLSLLFVLALSPAHAAGSEAFSEARFAELQATGKPILIDVRADWCPTCKKQGEVLAQFQRDNPQCGLNILEVDFDGQKKWVKHFGAPRQSTLLLFEGGERVWFSVAETRAGKIREAIFDAVEACNA